MIKNIIFDIDDTLFPTTEFAELARHNAVRAMMSLGIMKSEKKLYSLLQKIIKKRGSNYNHHFDELCKKLKIKNRARFVAAAVAAYHDTKTSIQTYPEVQLILLKLKERGYNIYIASNGNAVKQWDKLIRLRIALYFEDVFVSEEVGVQKSAEFFKKVMKKLGANANECMMVGDKEDADIIPARKLGMLTVKVMDRKKLNCRTSAPYKIAELGELLNILAKQ